MPAREGSDVRGHLSARVGRCALVVRRLFFHRQGEVDESCGAVEFVWDDRGITRIDTRSDWSLLVSDREWTDPFTQTSCTVDPRWVASVGKWERHDVSRREEYAALIGRALRLVTVTDNAVGEPVGIELEFDSATVSIRSVRGEPVVWVRSRVPEHEFVRVAWRHDLRGEPVTFLYETVDGVERRKIEIWDDGRTGFATRFVEHGGARHAETSIPPLAEINEDAQFEAVEISREEFETAWDTALSDVESVTLWRPVGPKELRLVEQAGSRRWPPRLPDQPIFYPVLSEVYATRVAREWNVSASGAGHVTCFRILREFLDRYQVQQAGGQDIREYWIPSEELEDLNDHIAGRIQLTASYRP